MKIIFKNKKGAITFDQLIYGILALLALGVGIYFVALGGDAGGIFKNILGDSTADFDGDGIPDAQDPCPCGFPPNQQNLQENIDGIQRCILSFSECSDKHKEFGFQTKKDIRDATVCTYLKPDCMKYIEHVTGN